MIDLFNLADAFTCPDCTSVPSVSEHTPSVRWLTTHHDPSCPRLALKEHWLGCRLGLAEGAELSMLVREPDACPILVRDVVKRVAAA